MPKVNLSIYIYYRIVPDSELFAPHKRTKTLCFESLRDFGSHTPSASKPINISSLKNENLWSDRRTSLILDNISYNLEEKTYSATTGLNYQCADDKLVCTDDTEQELIQKITNFMIEQGWAREEKE